MIKINTSNPEPIFLQISKGIIELIIEGTFKENSIIPSVRSLAFELKVNPNTVQRAYKELERDGWIGVLRGEGYIVKEIPKKGIEKYLKEKKNLIEKELYTLKKIGFKREEILNLINEIWREK